MVQLMEGNYNMIKFAEIDQSNSVITRLKEAKAASDSRDYEKKTRIIRELMHESPGDWNIDSEDKGIAGITHTPTSFRFHLPSQRVISEIRSKQKAALFEDFLNPQITESDPDPWRRRIDAVFNYDNGSALMGALAGGTVGGLSHLLPQTDKKKPKMSIWKKILAGTAIGGASGYGLAKALPETSANINQKILDNYVSPAIGRVATNLFTPEGYRTEGRMKDIIADKKKPYSSAWEAAKHVINDDKALTSDRDHLWRYIWNLEPRYIKATDGEYTQFYKKTPGGDKDDYEVPDKSTEEISQNLSDNIDYIIEGNDAGYFDKRFKKYNAMAKGLMKEKNMPATDAYLAAAKEYHKVYSPREPTLGRFNPYLKLDSEGGITSNINDPWNIDLNPGDTITHQPDLSDEYRANKQKPIKNTNILFSNLLRHLATKTTNGRSVHLRKNLYIGNIKDKIREYQPDDLVNYPSPGDPVVQKENDSEKSNTI